MTTKLFTGKRRKLDLLPLAPHLSPFFIFIVFFLITACSQKESSKPLPVELAREHACRVCGMIVTDLPGAKAQIHYGNGKVDTFCCTLHMFSFYLQPDRLPNIVAVYVTDMGKSDQDHPAGNWIDAKKAYYVYGGDPMGPHGEAMAPFSRLKDAENHIKEHRGRVVRFEEVTPEMLRPDSYAHF
jgi:copper chaperone NosL